MIRFIALLAPLALATPAWATGGDFIFTDRTGDLAVDPIADAHDTLDVDLVDVDGDGDLDLFTVEGSASAAPFANRLLINDGTGVFTDESATRLPPGPPANSTEVDFADIDDDGDLDAIVSNLGPNQLLVNDGTGHFTDASAQLPQAAPPGPPGFNSPFGFIEISAEAVFADVDGDDDPDILISNENPLPFGPPGDLNRLLLNDGAGNFSESFGRLPIAIDQTSGFIAGDIDGDDDLDLVQVNIGANLVFINNGQGFFTDETAARLPANSASSRKAIFADVDDDGDLDLFVANSRQEQNRLFINDGSGVFTDATANLPARLDTSTDVDMVDLDGDGDLDAYVTNVGDFVGGHGFLGDLNNVLLNDGHGRFTDGTFPRASTRRGRSTNADFGDVNGDGTPDVVIANSGGVDQPGLPPPDGTDRLFLLSNCRRERQVCIEAMLDGLDADIAALDPEPFPTGDMTGTSVGRNNLSKAMLAWWASRARAKTNAGRLRAARAPLKQIVRRTDGFASPPDWVAGDAATRLFLQARFGTRFAR